MIQHNNNTTGIRVRRECAMQVHFDAMYDGKDRMTEIKIVEDVLLRGRSISKRLNACMKEGIRKRIMNDLLAQGVSLIDMPNIDGYKIVMGKLGELRKLWFSDALADALVFHGMVIVPVVFWYKRKTKGDNAYKQRGSLICVRIEDRQILTPPPIFFETFDFSLYDADGVDPELANYTAQFGQDEDEANDNREDMNNDTGTNQTNPS